MKSRVAIFAALVFQIACAFAWTADTLPDPQKDFTQCGRKVPSFICSPDGLVDSRTLDVIQGDINAIYDGSEPYAKMYCPATGQRVEVQVLAVVVGKVDGPGDASKRVQRFATGVHDRFGVGSKECGSGVVIAVSVEDRQVYISAGDLILPILPTHRIEALIRGVKPQLRDGKYGKALEKLVVETGLILASDCAQNEGKCDSDEGDDEDGPWWLPIPIVAGVASIFGLFALQNVRAGRKRQDVASNLRKLQNDLKASKEGRYISTSCPICLEDFSTSDSREAPSDSPNLQDTDSSLNSNAATSEESPLLREGQEAGYLPAMHAQQTMNLNLNSNSKLNTSADGGQAQEPRLPFVLPCGHSFCEPCIMDWISKKPECPVCRKPVSGDGAGDASATAPNNPTTNPGAAGPSTGAGAPPDPQNSNTRRPPFLRLRPPRGGFGCSAYGLGYDDFGPELAFRLHRLRRRHGHHLSQEVIDDLIWEANGGVGPRPGSRRGGRHRHGPIEDWGSHPEYLRQMDEAARQARERSGAQGSAGRSFGGGRSAGGGGGGW